MLSLFITEKKNPLACVTMDVNSKNKIIFLGLKQIL